MKKFSSIRPKKEGEVNTEKDNLYDGEYVKVKKWKGFEITEGRPCVISIPYFIDQNSFLIRKEFIPAFNATGDPEYHISTIGGGIEGDETPEEALLRELQEEAGIVLRENFKIELEGPIYVSKYSSQKIWFSILTLTKNDYHEIPIKVMVLNWKKWLIQ